MICDRKWRVEGKTYKMVVGPAVMHCLVALQKRWEIKLEEMKVFLKIFIGSDQNGRDQKGVHQRNTSDLEMKPKSHG